MSTPSSMLTDPHQKRPEFLIEMYKQMLNDINTHILVVWQSVGVLVGSVIRLFDSWVPASVSSFSASSSSGWTPLSRGSHGRFGLCRFRAKLTPNALWHSPRFHSPLPP
jgi:hypothetical protein